MGDERYAARPEAAVLGRARDLRPEFLREDAPDGRDVDADLLEDAAAHDRHDAAPAAFGAERRVRPPPFRTLEAGGRAGGEGSTEERREGKEGGGTCRSRWSP